MIIFPALSIGFRAQLFVPSFFGFNLSCQILRAQKSSPKIKKTTQLASGSNLFSLNSLTETPPATRLDAM